MIHNFQLKNGIKCVINVIDGVFSVTSGILVGAGSVLETTAENGISHFIEHVNFKGTEKRSAFQISRDTDNLGAQINAFTSKEFTCYYMKSTGEHFAEAFEILSDMFVNSVYDENELKKERGVVIEEINMYEDTPDEVATDKLSEAFFGNNGYGSTILGSIGNVSSFNRKSVLDYKKKYYTTDNIVISIAGAVSVDQAKELCEKYFSGIIPSEKSRQPEINTVNLCRNFSVNKDIEQAHIALAVEAVPLTGEYANEFSVISGALGGGMSSRLFQTVREKLGLCYSVYSYLSSYVMSGCLSVYAGVGLKNYKEAFDAIMAEIEKLKAEGITEDEFLRTREQIKSTFVLAQESTASQMILYGKHYLLTGEIFDVTQKLSDINKMTAESVNRVISERLSFEKMATSIVGKGVKPLY